MTRRAAPAPDALFEGGKPVLARALAAVEARPDDPLTLDLLDAAHARARAHVIGLTGPPGVGKSTLTSSLVRAFRAAGLAVGVVAVDPSSRRSGGALLGDRTRIEVDPEDAGVFVRSMAARDRLGGLAGLTTAAVVLMRAVFDRVIVETVGVGQSETEIERVADTVVFCVQPASGDALQFMKAGIVEIPDIAVVTKADLGAPADRARRELRAALSLAGGGHDGWSVPVLAVAAGEGRGLDGLLTALDDHARHAAEGGRLERRRHARAEAWLAEAVREEFGRAGLARARTLPGGLTLNPGEAPFRRMRALRGAVAGGFAAGGEPNDS